MANDSDGAIHGVSEGGVLGKHPNPAATRYLVAPSTADEFNKIGLPLVPIFCWKVEDIRFAFDSSFVSIAPDPSSDPTSDPLSRPDAGGDIREELRILADFVNSSPGCPPSVFGHADPVGPAVDPDGYNKALSGRRATSIYSLLIANTSLSKAVSLWNGIAATEHWGADQKGMMQQVTGLPDGTSMSSLIQAYLPLLCPKDLNLAPKDFLAQGANASGKGDYQGCSSFNPLLIFSQDNADKFAPGANNQDHQVYLARNLANAPNRRVMVLLFRKGTRVDPAKWPCPPATGDKAGCIKRFWKDGQDRRGNRLPSRDRRFDDANDTFACRFYQRLLVDSPCDGVHKIVRVRLFDPEHNVLVNAPFLATLDGIPNPAASSTDASNATPTASNFNRTIRGRSNANGDAVLFNVVIPSTVTMQWSRPPEPPDEDDGSDAAAAKPAPDPEPGEFEFELDVYLDLTGQGIDATEDTSAMTQEEATRRLSNLGYSQGSTMADNLRKFQQDLNPQNTNPSATLDADTIKALREHHDVLRAPPALPDTTDDPASENSATDTVPN